VSLDRASERGADGRPASALRRQSDVVHAAIAVDLTKPSKYPRAGISDIHPRRARFDVALTLRSHRPQARTLAFELDPWHELELVSDESGAPLVFLRDHVGGRSAGIDDQLWDNSVIVLLPEPIGAGERVLRFVYEAEILNYVSGRAWYPGEEEAHADPHTAELVLTALPKHELRAMGREIESRDEQGRRFRRYAIERPARMVTFTFAEKFEEQRLDVEGGPTIAAFSARAGGRAKAFNVAADVANAWSFFERWLGRGPASSTVYATSIVGHHGQAFDGFLHLAESSWETESRGPTELFRAHEVAHAWWGHLVGWRSYRDQWLSESFAEYSAMRFVEAAVPDGAARYAEMVETM
ncbi:MAG: M1 family aminopeptidase, partial [Myxococcota bacterium]